MTQDRREREFIDERVKVTFSIKKNMWKPESKRKVDTRESNKAYDATKRERPFQPYWLQMYKWLHFDGESADVL